MSQYSFGRHDVRPESKVTQEIVRPGVNLGKTERQRRMIEEAIEEANKAMPHNTMLREVSNRSYRQGLFHGLVIAVLGGLLLYAATHLH